MPAPAAPPPAAPAIPSTSAPAAPAAAPKITIGAQQPVSPAMQRSFERMQKMATPDSPKPSSEVAPEHATQLEPKEETSKLPEKKVQEPVKEPEAKAEPEGKETPEQIEGKEDGKSAPSWKLVQSYKAEAKALKKELAELRNGSGNLPQLQEQLKFASERAEKAEKKAKELSDHMRFLDYQRSDEFVTSYQKPYEEACKLAASDLAQLTIEGADGTARNASINDLLALCNMPLGQARQQAEAWFGSSADDVMAHRREIQRLYQNQQKAIEEARTKGDERLKTQAQGWQKIQEESASLWQQYNKEDVEKYDFLKPKDGDKEFNERLEKAKGVVESAFSGNALDPKLSSEERAKIIRAQVAVRNRAIGYSTLKLENKRLQAQLAEKDKALKEFQGSEPTAGRGKNGVAPSTPADPMAAAMARMKQPKYVT